jgi:hypothetical protein
MKYLPAIIYHLLPVIPLAFGYPFLAIATSLLVALAYVKVHKLKQLEIENRRKQMKADPSIGKAIGFWERLTFLKRNQAE